MHILRLKFPPSHPQHTIFTFIVKYNNMYTTRIKCIHQTKSYSQSQIFIINYKLGGGRGTR